MYLFSIVRGLRTVQEAWNSCRDMTAEEAKAEYVRRARQVEKLYIGGRL